MELNIDTGEPIRLKNQKPNPPPICIKRVQKFAETCEKLELIEADNLHCKFTTDRPKVMTCNLNSYRTFTLSKIKMPHTIHTN